MSVDLTKAKIGDRLVLRCGAIATYVEDVGFGSGALPHYITYDAGYISGQLSDGTSVRKDDDFVEADGRSCDQECDFDVIAVLSDLKIESSLEIKWL